MRDRTAAARIGVVIYEGVEPIDIGGTVGVVSMASRLKWPRDFGQGDKLVLLERETGRDGQSDARALRG